MAETAWIVNAASQVMNVMSETWSPINVKMIWIMVAEAKNVW